MNPAMTPRAISSKRSTAPLTNFFSLTPDQVLLAVEELGYRCTGLCYPLNSLENRVYEIELDDRRRIVSKFYRPGRWSRETIQDEHQLLAALTELEIPVCAPLTDLHGATLHQSPSGILYALFPRIGGRIPDELTAEQLEQLGRLIARVHNVCASLKLKNRLPLTADTYGRQALAMIINSGRLPPEQVQRFSDAVEMLLTIADERFRNLETFVIHADLHRGNLLYGRNGWTILDFDDAAVGPPVQDFWLLLPARHTECKSDVEALLAGYQQFRQFPRSTLRLIEVLRGLRYLRYAAWIAQRWDDPSFPRAFPDWGTDRYWQQLIIDLYDQVRLLRSDFIDET